MNKNGVENLIHNGYRFHKNGFGKTNQLWRCSSHASQKCKAAAKTGYINGFLMMKMICGDHTHQPNNFQRLIKHQSLINHFDR